MAQIPSDEELQNRIRDFLRNIPRRKADFGDPGPSGGTGYPHVQDDKRTTLDSGEVSRSADVAPPPNVDFPVPITNHYSFEGVDASDEDGAKVLIYDGLVGTPSDQEVPAGMGGDNYILSVANGNVIWVGITYNTDSFEITSRFLDIGSTVPDDTFGAAYFKIMDVAVVGGDSVTAFPANSHCGDIIFTFEFGGLNGKPAIKLTPAYGDWIELPSE